MRFVEKARTRRFSIQPGWPDSNTLTVPYYWRKRHDYFMPVAKGRKPVLRHTPRGPGFNA